MPKVFLEVELLLNYEAIKAELIKLLPINSAINLNTAVESVTIYI